LKSHSSFWVPTPGPQLLGELGIVNFWAKASWTSTSVVIIFSSTNSATTTDSRMIMIVVSCATVIYIRARALCSVIIDSETQRNKSFCNIDTTNDALSQSYIYFVTWFPVYNKVYNVLCGLKFGPIKRDRLPTAHRANTSTK
jgi:hypothetical protein